MESIGPIALIILDGFGYRKETIHNAIAKANTPHLDAWFATCPFSLLEASGTHVGLLAGAIGNSEVGHLTIGAGRVISQPVTQIHEAIHKGTFYYNPVLLQALAKIKQHSERLHIIGLCSDAQVHSDIEHMYALLKAAQAAGIKSVFLHLILDGRDVPPQSAATYLKPLSNYLSQTSYGIIGSLHGRFYAMDRDNNGNRTEKSYNVLTGREHSKQKTWEEILANAYRQNITDEFITPVLLDADAFIKAGDGVIFFNTRPDRIAQLAESLVGFDLSCFVTLIDYGLTVSTEILFEQQPIFQTFKDVLAAAHKRMFVIAETEKYAHVTYFFTGMRRALLPGETRVLIPSLKLDTYAQQPNMSAPEITKAILETMEKPYDFYLINYANADMVGHSGNLEATSKAIECLDAQLGLLYDAFVTQHHGTLYITADHGNAEEMFDPISGQPKTAHTTNRVPFLVVSTTNTGNKELSLSELADIAPYILRSMQLPVPDEMKLMQDK